MSVVKYKGRGTGGAGVSKKKSIIKQYGGPGNLHNKYELTQD